MAAGVVVVLLALAMSATPSAALGGQFTISPGSGPVGTVVTVSGTGCSPGFSVTSSDYVRVVATDVTVKSFQVDASGAWGGTITMDNAGLIGLVVITATCHTNGIPSLTTLYPIRTFDVTAPPAPSTTTTTQAPATTTTPPTTTAGSGGSGTTTTTAPPAPTTTTDVDGAGPTTTVGSNGSSGGEGSTGSGSGGTGSSGSGSGSDGSSGTGSDGDGSTGSGSSGSGSTGNGSNGAGSDGDGSSGNGSSGNGSNSSGSNGSGSAGSGSVGGDQSSGLPDDADGSSADTAADGETVEGSAERNVENGDVDDEVALAVATAPASLSDLTMGESADDGVGWLRWLLAAIALAIGIAAVVKRQAIARLIG